MRNRRQSRELALQVIFQLDVAGGDPAEAFDLVVRLAAEDPEDTASPPLTDEVREFARNLLDGTISHLPEIDDKLRTYAREWSLERMANVDRNILRLALYEMLFLEDVPLSVSINEAVELAKTYSTRDSGRFINGILGKIAVEMPPEPGQPGEKAAHTNLHTGERIRPMFKILSKRELTPVTKHFVVQAPLVAKKAKPGQFVIVRVTGNGERIPLTIADSDAKAGTVTIVIQEVGKTSRLVGALKEGDLILDFVGPLGRPCPLTDKGPVVLVGGGFGVAPIYPIAKALRAKGVKVTSIIGARTEDLLILEQEMTSVSDRLLVATDDGSKGHHGFVTDVLKQLIDSGEDIEQVIAIGPMVMMRAVAKTTEPYKLQTLVSVDPIMVDGTGMCGACRLTVAGQVKFACVDGPIFDAHQVDFAETVRRGKMYSGEQKIALDRMDSGQRAHTGGCACGHGGGR